MDTLKPFTLSYSLVHDPLSIFFLIVIAVVSIPSLVHAVGYLKGHGRAEKNRVFWALCAIFVASMAAVVSSGNLLFFLFAWEAMSLASYLLVVFDHEDEGALRAGTVYAIMTHAGTACIIAAFMILYNHAGTMEISQLKSACASMPDSSKNLVFVLLLAGFGAKAGIVPLHVWLPLAHPQAPSPVSSMMSGVMVKTAIYGFLRFNVQILGSGPAWWGGLVLVLASVSCLIGVIYALMEHDLKRLLAYSSVENIGIILLGIGAGMVFEGMGLPALAVLAMTAGLFHLANHAVFKGLLFLCAGNIYKATGLRNIEELGGLAKRMPWTAGAFLAGAMAISAIPPFNGFVSEWLTFQAFFLGAMNATDGAVILFGLLAAVLAFTGGLAAYTFVKAYGITFLAAPRGKAAASAKESPLSMTIPVISMAVLAGAMGLGSSWLIPIIKNCASCATGIDASGIQLAFNNFSLALPETAGPAISVPFLTLAIAGILLVVLLCARLFTPNTKTRPCITWNCGYYHNDSRNEYTATAFSKPFRLVFGFLLLPFRKKEKEWATRYNVRSFKYEVHTTPIFDKYLYDPLLNLTLVMARYTRRMQTGSIHIYIAYIALAIIVLLIAAGVR